MKGEPSIGHLDNVFRHIDNVSRFANTDGIAESQGALPKAQNEFRAGAGHGRDNGWGFIQPLVKLKSGQEQGEPRRQSDRPDGV